MTIAVATLITSIATLIGAVFAGWRNKIETDAIKKKMAADDTAEIVQKILEEQKTQKAVAAANAANATEAAQQLLAQMNPNGGSSLRDAINSIQKTTQNHSQELARVTEAIQGVKDATRRHDKELARANDGLAHVAERITITDRNTQRIWQTIDDCDCEKKQK